MAEIFNVREINFFFLNYTVWNDKSQWTEFLMPEKKITVWNYKYQWAEFLSMCFAQFVFVHLHPEGA